MRVFVTGGSGYIGAHIVLELLKRGHDITVLTRDLTKAPRFSESPRLRLRYVEGSLDDTYVIQDALLRQDAIIHNAVIWDDKVEDNANDNVLAALRLWSSSGGGVKRFLYTSSTAVHRPFTNHMSEKDNLDPTDIYGVTKSTCEMLISKMKMDQACIIRPGPTIGLPAWDGGKVNCDLRFHQFIESARKDEPIEVVRNDGRQFIHASDLAKVYAIALESRRPFEIYLAVATDFITWEEIAHMVVKETDSKSQVVATDEGLTPEPFRFDVSKLDRDFGLSFTCRDKMPDFIRYLVSRS